MSRQARSDTPIPGRLYALTGTRDKPSIMRGDSWASSEIRRCCKCGDAVVDDMDVCRAHVIKKLKGMTCGVLRNKSIGDCSAGGLSSSHDVVILIGDGIPQIFEPSDVAPAVMVCFRGLHMYAKPLEQPSGMVGPMFGGSFIYTSDSRFPSEYPMPLHDRFETAAMARSFD